MLYYTTHVLAGMNQTSFFALMSDQRGVKQTFFKFFKTFSLKFQPKSRLIKFKTSAVKSIASASILPLHIRLRGIWC